MLITHMVLKLLALAVPITAYGPFGSLVGQSSASLEKYPNSRRSFFSSSFKTGAVLAATGFLPTEAKAGTTIDIQRYGDKELKIATINKIKQLLRNELLQNPAQAGDWVRLALSDALAFNQAADAGGPDASVAFDEAALAANGGKLKKALGVMKAVQKAVLKTTEVSLADVIAYGGAEAIEASGGPRIAVQIGRYDATKPVAGAQPALSWEADGKSAECAVADVRAAFEGAGFTAKDMVVLVGAIGSVERAAVAAVGGRATVVRDPNDDDDEMFPADGGIFIPNTFGSQKAMFGDLLTKDPFDLVVFKEKGAGDDLVAAVLTGSEVAKQAAAKFAGGKTDVYRKELADAYAKVTVAGASLTGAKVLAP